MHHCEVMLKDLADAKRINTTVSAAPPAPGKPAQPPSVPGAAVGLLSASLISHLFWPEAPEAELLLPPDVQVRCPCGWVHVHAGHWRRVVAMPALCAALMASASSAPSSSLYAALSTPPSGDTAPPTHADLPSQPLIPPTPTPAGCHGGVWPALPHPEGAPPCQLAPFIRRGGAGAGGGRHRHRLQGGGWGWAWCRAAGQWLAGLDWKRMLVPAARRCRMVQRLLARV
jgi:hypothetical protein